MKKDASNQQQTENTQNPDETQTPNDGQQSSQRGGEPARATSDLSSEEIARRAHAIYEGRGGFPGAELDDWLQAERELLQQSGSKPNRAA